jgi:hypothetical protein
MGLRAGLNTDARGKILCFCRRSNPGRPVCSHILPPLSLVLSLSLSLSIYIYIYSTYIVLYIHTHTHTHIMFFKTDDNSIFNTFY